MTPLARARWEAVGTDISAEMVSRAKEGLYGLARTEQIPKSFLKRYCLKGTGPYAGKLLVEQRLRRDVRVAQLNLNGPLPEWEPFDVLFLRNVMIYFSAATKRALIDRLMPLNPTGRVFVRRPFREPQWNKRRTGVGEARGISEATMTVAKALPTDMFLQPGQWYFGKAGPRFRTTLGSCVAICLWHPHLRIGGMCHYMLPTRLSQSSEPDSGRYGDEAFELLLREARKAGTQPQDYEVKLFGGGNMFAGTRQLEQDVAARNIAKARDLVAAHGLRVKAQSLGGLGYRQLLFDLATGDVWVRQGPQQTFARPVRRAL